MILSDKTLRDRIIQDHEKAERAREWWKKGEWDKIGNKILIDPFKTHAVGPCSYDLSVGEEYRSLRDPRTNKPLKEGENICIGPGESVLILTEEYVCLPRNTLAMIVPRARWIFEGTSICATRIDPTWYGKLLIGFTNSAKNPVELYRNEAFCTCYFMETSETETILTKDKVPFLGRTNIGRINFSHAMEQKLLSADKVDQDDIEKVVDLYGWPWDVARGMFTLNRKLLMEYIDTDVYNNLLEEATLAISSKVSEEISRVYRTIIGALVGLGATVVGLLYLFYLLLSSH